MVKISRRDFLKVGGTALASLMLAPRPVTFSLISRQNFYYPDPFRYQPDRDQGILGRIASIFGVDLRLKANDSSEIVGKRFRDQVVNIYEELEPPGGPEYYNWTWYRVWGGYLHSAHIQKVRIQLNEPASSISENGTLAEVTVPYSTAVQFNDSRGWSFWRGSRLYYESIHWLTGIREGPDGEPWYQITSELSKGEKYYVPARHLRLLREEEYAPISPEVPLQHKRIVVSLSEQRLRLFEYEKELLNTRISSGVPTLVPNGSLPTATPTGTFRIYAKQPSKHMGSVAGGAEIETNDGFSLPGVPWTSFFKSPGGYALHGTYWHNNFGLQMSHGCINMRNEDAKFVFRWSSPVYETKIESISDWERTGYGTVVEIY